MDRLETRELAYFVAVAEELHFARAAERLGIAAPPLSRAIARLERRLGVRLFERTSRRVDLTDAGTVFLAESRVALAAVDTAVRRAQRAARPARLVVAVRSGTGAGLLSDVLETYAHRPGAVPVELLFTTDQPKALREGTADVALFCASADTAGLTTTELALETPVALLPASHQLASRAAIPIDELRRVDAFRASCPPVSLDEIVDRVALGELVVVVGHSAASRVGDAVVAVPVVGQAGTTLVLGRAAGKPSADLRAFERAARDVVARRRATA
ncbi:LysR family transcriptional regulator [Amycolatopsis rhabdoformis]|uniref:LysR family transcriptional regulator n=1 Tax=Amycolatopsis rhabdoformis TaxID=1448059 RepID=A0ABZ1HW53_9PSEU|nr:LysR family transcriptional regulator [Amycolatopsis rhabdoformis]WSE26461.1 LysR family transcriptional regulator [Amycolatopsis rhabdoformis]